MFRVDDETARDGDFCSNRNFISLKRRNLFLGQNRTNSSLPQLTRSRSRTLDTSEVIGTLVILARENLFHLRSSLTLKRLLHPLKTFSKRHDHCEIFESLDFNLDLIVGGFLGLDLHGRSRRKDVRALSRFSFCHCLSPFFTCKLMV